MMLGYPYLLERAEGRQDGSSHPYWVLSIVIRHFDSLKRSAAVFRSPTSLARRIDKDTAYNRTATVRSAVAVGSLPQGDLAAFAALAAVAVAAAAVWHGHQLIPMTFSVDLNCSDLPSLIHQPKLHDIFRLQVLKSINVPHGCRMLSDDFIAERLRPDVCKIVLAVDAADFQPVRCGFILQSQMRHVDVFHFANSTSMESVFCCRYWLHCKTQVTHHALNAFRF